MKIIVVGAEGDIGEAACEELGRRHDLVRVGRSSGEIQVDMSDPSSVDEMYARVGTVDAVVSTAGMCISRRWVNIPRKRSCLACVKR
ncbi:NAD-dependent epimerase/dehydratase family protein [Aurantimonas sp. C2-6-R+9]|uniref:NAD-dependent epimerase/dehydratase family protein n=1 Tax=unclassified Aurantimonas TaxID=2638230 RepID=UPI002E178868|nr:MULTISPECIES: NAD-dependent epimerase/dehydratase family protein [unclassified Aurantimonas]MEC5290088.1 NAD-dependent epimerase/dehydratase family protein [Aurantimonas sp. C2-3-R2]MEC5380201.1 NAD-dependent epimerase/dehydratase family protein [Aurantimonas sp. C2-6-R+9]MEC5411152.1 NAD-dependent epimerase/dehydratase family protein [Aurantimonas sp. C2-4-R8]